MNINAASQQLITAITQFINHKDFSVDGNKQFKHKQKCLINFSKELQCVPVCIQILSEQPNEQIKYFASMLLKDKLKYDYYQLNDNAIGQTHSMLVSLINKLEKPSKILLNNIVLCLVYLYIHSIQNIGSILQFLRATFAQQAQNSSLEILATKNKFVYFFKFLELLPQQIHNNKVVIDEQSRNNALTLIQNQQTQILKQMHEIFTNFNTSTESGNNQNQNKLSHIQQQILINAFSSWIQINTSNLQVIYSLHHHGIMKLTVYMLSDELIFQSAARCLRNIIEIMGIPGQNNQQLFLFITQHLLSSLDKFSQLTKQCSYQIVQQYVKVLCDYGSISAPILIMQYNQNIQKFIHHMLMYIQTPEIEIFDSLVDFWQCFIDALIKYSSTQVSASNNNNTSIISRQIANQILGRLFMILFQRIKYSLSDLEYLNEMSEKNLVDLHQKADDIETYRQQGGYLFYSISKYLGKQTYVKEVLTAIRNLDKSDQTQFWTLTQAMVSSLRDVSDKYPAPTEQICEIVLLYEEFKSSYIMVRRSFCRLFHELFTMENKNEQFILRILGYVIDMLEVPLLSDRAEKAFNKCCRQNQKIVGKHIQKVYNLINIYPNKIGLLSGIAHVIKQSPQMIAAVVPNLASIQIKNLEQIFSASDVSIKANKKSLLNIFQNIFSLLRCLPSQEISQSNIEFLSKFLTSIWPYLQKLISNPVKRETDEDRLVQQSVKFLKIVMRLIPDKFLNYLQDISLVIVTTFKKYPLSSFVYYYELVFTQYRNNKDQAIQKYLLQFFVEICNITFKHVQQFGGIVALPILVDDFMGLAKRIVTYNKLTLLLQSQKIDDIFKFALLGLQSSQPKIASSCSQFFQIVFMIYWTPQSRKRYLDQGIGQVVEYDYNSAQLYQQLKQYMLPMVPSLISGLFKCLSKVPVESARQNILDCLSAIALAFPSQSQQLWLSPLNSLQNDILTTKQKNKLKKSLKGLGSNDPTQFYNSQLNTNKLLFLISSRYMHRDSRENLSTYK